MNFIDNQTVIDLEFETIKSWLINFAINPTAKNKLANLQPTNDFQEIKNDLFKLNEFFQIRIQSESFPVLDFEELLKEIKLLKISKAVIEQEGFIRIYRASSLVNSIIYFFDKRLEDFPFLIKLLEDVYFTNEICLIIDKVFDKKGQIKDDASPLLFQIRQKIISLRNQINKNFEKEVRRFNKEGFLSEIKETFVNERRVLAINSTHKRKIGGSVLGSSKTGSITFIEPQINIELNNELELLIDDERNEIFRILQQLTNEISAFHHLIVAYQELLTELDFINAKSKLAIDLKCNLPSINDDQVLELIDAFHPILLKTNQTLGKKTIPQAIKLDKTARFLVISGPNAGGKSITLKTVGLFQLMLQAGLLVPCHPNSKMCFFQQILSDIGDNQSIQNELSTYSYRLKRMKYFLEVSNRKTLLLLDEFGTGSDPDLGGALAEVFFEHLYNKKSFGIITTHYSNIKLKTDRLKNAVNGCMLFDTNTLEPLYRFSIGQPGSSFTFEVALMNGISVEIIEDAKTKISEQKINMDRLLSDLQKEKTYLEKLNNEHITAQQLAEEARVTYTERKVKLEQKLRQQAEFMEINSKFINNGKKLKSYIDRFVTKSKKKDINNTLIEEIKKFLSIEKSKIEEQKLKEKLILDSNKIPKNNKKVQKIKEDLSQKDKIKIGSIVKLIETKQTGKVEEINGKMITVSFGFIRMKVDLEKLIWIG
jgi:DNA mismatch repair protein MutS2